MQVWGWALLGMFAGLPAAASAQVTLELEDVLESVHAHHPRVVAALSRRARAEGEVMAARGGFDPTLSGKAMTRDGDGYGRSEVDVELLAPTPLWGTETYAGYRLGRARGDDVWPTYDPDRTLEGGELRAGIRVPLWRGGPIDERRARIRTTTLRERAAAQDVASTLLDLRQGAMAAYWQWVAAGRALVASEQLLAIAVQREEQLERTLKAGAVPAIDVVDNRHMRFERMEKLAAAPRKLQRTAYALALYYRSEDGRPEPPELRRGPAAAREARALQRSEPWSVGRARRRAPPRRHKVRLRMPRPQPRPQRDRARPRPIARQAVT